VATELLFLYFYIRADDPRIHLHTSIWIVSFWRLPQPEYPAVLLDQAGIPPPSESIRTGFLGWGFQSVSRGDSAKNR